MFDKYYSKRIQNTPPSFIRESLKVIQNPNIISFAGGLPNPISFPQKELQDSMNRIAKFNGDKIYQYSNTLGLETLRQFIVDRYKKTMGMNLELENVMVTTGSQQALDLLGKVFINSGDKVLIEEPSYLGFLQAFCMYEAEFVPTKLEEYGLNIDALKQNIINHKPKLAYLIPNFQNPTGLTYTEQNRKDIFDVIKEEDLILVQDDPYGDLRFDDKERIPYIGINQSDKNIYLGSFSKIIAPGMRLGYIIAHKDIIRKLEIAKQSADLHSNIYSQYLISDYLYNNDLDEHIKKIRNLYKTQSNAMVEAMSNYFPKDIKFTIPKGGMFCWVTLKDGQSALDLFYKAVEKNVAFIPGIPFYINRKDVNTLRLNYTNATAERIEEGIKRLASAMI